MFESFHHDDLKTIWNSKAFSAELLFPPSEFPLKSYDNLGSMAVSTYQTAFYCFLTGSIL